MHIALTGAHGVGKTTLGEVLVSKLASNHSVALIPETARELVRLGLKVNEEMNEEGFISYIQLYLRAVRETNAEIVISDRSLFDLYLYTHRGNNPIRHSYIEMLYELVFLEASLVDFYVYLPIEFPMMADTIRPPDVSFQKQVDDAAVKLLKEFKMKTVEARGSISDRCATIIRRLTG